MKPGRNDACSNADLSTAVISFDGKVRKEKFSPNLRVAIDCFYERRPRRGIRHAVLACFPRRMPKQLLPLAGRPNEP